ncbi:hypothetical protein PK98_08645 [Croceibacterium mercuriale]|uniref:Uncharacterized protein n=1 Tax=Croceibacterium mercuriale TaxID=1572751 RepID=A0A0B2BYE5_9SPHN|nr:DUF892 family protein [Croceibacterium mercuriale]KHL26474.1 hypothetical protein PK98_08645 [Croceibacterium mercuriale]
MPQVDSARGLLVEALQDMADAARALAERGDGLADAVNDDALRMLIVADVRAAAREAGALIDLLTGLGAAAGGADNIWLRAILDDAGRDTETEARGRWRDVALVGALRKGKQAQRVSHETALALAEHLGDAEMAAVLRGLRDDAALMDTALAERLHALTG